MTDSEPQSQPPSRPPLGRRRRANVARGRRVAYQVKLTEEEQVRLLELAEAQQVTIPRLLVESALASGMEATPARRRQAMVRLFKIEHLLATVANNVNQLARIANISGQVPGRLGPVLVELREVMGQIVEAIDGLEVR